MKVLMYHHGSSYNHGCEAILRTVSGIIRTKYPEAEFDVSSHKPAEDAEMIDTENGRYTFLESDCFAKLPFEKRRLIVGSLSTVLHNIHFFKKTFKYTVKSAKEADLIISVGGDTYSYGKSCELTTIDNKLRKLCKNSVLWGCSINPEFLTSDKYKYKLRGLKDFSLITARESITYETLKGMGFDNVKLFPDPAFTLRSKEPDEPMFENGKDIVGINLSPLIITYEQTENRIFRCYVDLMKKILDTTDYNIALISHVICKTSNDTDSANRLAAEFKGSDRIKIFDKGNAEEIKGRIAKCRFFVAARTHASIAAYSKQIPTLVVGYSVKSTGIAKDIFGTHEGYVINVRDLNNDSALTDAFFENIVKNENAIREHYSKMMPDYISKAYLAADEIVRIFGEKKETIC